MGDAFMPDLVKAARAVIAGPNSPSYGHLPADVSVKARWLRSLP